MKFTVDEFLARLPLAADDNWTEGVWDIKPFEKAGVKLVFFAPREHDYQSHHDEDEFYFIVRGTGNIAIDGKRYEFSPGDVFFVGSGIAHRFENFSDDLATWAIFF